MSIRNNLTEVLNKLRNKYTKPKDLSSEQILLGEKCIPHIITAPVGLELASIESKSIHPVLSKFSRNENKPMEWTEVTKPVGFSATGRFLVAEELKNSDLWFIKGKKNVTLGPFTISEMYERMKGGELENSAMKRTGDTIFVSFLKIKKTCPLLFNDSNISTVFEVIKDEKKTAVSANTQEIVNTENYMDRCTKSIQFLKSRNTKLELTDIKKMIEGLTKKKALTRLNERTGMVAEDNAVFLNGFISESRFKICSDVDSDGFQSVTKGRK